MQPIFTKFGPKMDLTNTNFFRKKNLKKLMTSAKISNFRIFPIFADVIIFFKNSISNVNKAWNIA